MGVTMSEHIEDIKEIYEERCLDAIILMHKNISLTFPHAKTITFSDKGIYLEYGNKEEHVQMYVGITSQVCQRVRVEIQNCNDCYIDSIWYKAVQDFVYDLRGNEKYVSRVVVNLYILNSDRDKMSNVPSTVEQLDEYFKRYTI